METRKKMIGVIGSSQVDQDNYLIAEKLGRILIDNGYRVATGGLKGVMEASLKGAKQSSNYRSGDTVAIIPQSESEEANEYADIVIATGVGIARNLILVQSVFAIIAIEGSWGTLSEICFGIQQNKPIILLSQTGGWSGKLFELRSEFRREFQSAQSLEEVRKLLKSL